MKMIVKSYTENFDKEKDGRKNNTIRKLGNFGDIIEIHEVRKRLPRSKL